MAYEAAHEIPPSRALDVFPSAIPIEDIAGIGLRKLTTNAAKASPGQISYPHSNTDARATPEAGHTGETLPLVKGTDSPSLPAVT